ncbi:cytochrome-c peroxidase [Bacteroidota bacterium]
MKYKAIFLSLLVLVVLGNCKKDDPDIIDPDPGYKPTPYNIEVPFRFPTQLHIPADNLMTVEGIKLGRYLFYDGRVGGRTHPDSLMSCATCHKQSLSFECGIHPQGITGIPTPHAMLPMINLVWNPGSLLWGGNVKKIEDLVWMGIVAPHEMNSDTNRAKQTIQNIPMYPPMFEKAFGTPEVTVKRMGKAIAQFVRTLISANSKFDKYMHGELQLTSSELNGFVLFTTEEGADCFHCHGGDGNMLFTTHLFYNNGLDAAPYIDTRDRYNSLIKMGETPTILDKGAYKATTLRNVEFTGPYMHDGRFSTLDEVIDFYSGNLKWSSSIHPLMHKIVDGGAQLTPAEKADLKAFILTLSDMDFLTNPDFAKPNDPNLP